jgi:hypothetical protein
MSGNSFAKFFINGDTVFHASHPIGLNYSALGPGKPSLSTAMGYYGTQPANLPDPPNQKGIVDIITTKLTDISDNNPPPPPEAPQLTIRPNSASGVNSFEDPILQREPGQKRGWFYPSVVYSHSNFHVFSPVDDDTGRHLWTTTLNEPHLRRKLKDNVEQVTVWKSGSTFHMSGIEKRSNGTYRRFIGASHNRVDWVFGLPGNQPETGGFPTGDIHTFIPTEGVWIKGHEWHKDSNGGVTDYFRPWFFEGAECTGLIPPPPSDGLRYSVYGMSVLKPADHGWQSKTTFVALIMLFKITDPEPTGWQHGPSDLVWATSDNGIQWKLPWGAEPAVERKAHNIGMVGPSYNMLPWGNQLLVHCGLHEVEHNEWSSNPDSLVGMGLASISKEKFEEAFG